MYHYSYYLFYCYPLCLSDINLFNPKRMIESIFSPKLRSTIYALGRVNIFLINEEARTVRIVNDMIGIPEEDLREIYLSRQKDFAQG